MKLVEALLKDAEKLGVVIVRDGVVAVDRRGDRVTGVTARESYSAPDVVIAGGAWSGQIGGLPRPLTVEPMRGQMAALAWPPGVAPAVVMGKSCYLVAREGEAVVGSTTEHAGLLPRSRLRGWRRSSPG